MATITIETDLDVVSKQQQLVEEALSPDGVYIRMKTTLKDLLTRGELKGENRGKVIAETVAQMSSQITATCISAGLQWAEAEKRLALQKEEMQYQVDLLAAQKAKIEEDAKNSLIERQLKQAQLLRLYGATPVYDVDGNVIGLSEDGKEYASIQNINKDTEVKEHSRLKLVDDLLTSNKQREVLDTQKGLYTRQTQAFDDNKYQKLLDSQLNYNGMIFQDATNPDVLNVALENKVNDVFNKLIGTSEITPMPEA